jgi:hypothetical protein
MNGMRNVRAMAILGAVLLTGCGSAGTPTTAPTPHVPVQPTQVIGIPQPGSTGQGEDPNAQQILRAMGQATNALSTATYDGVMYCRGGKGTKPKVLPDLGGEWEATTVYQVAYKRSERYRIDVTKCSNPASVGMKLSVDHTHATVRLTGVLGLVPLGIDMGDSKMLNFRGHRLDAGSLTGLARRFGNGEPTAHFAGQMELDGAACDVVEIPHAPSFDAAVSKEVLGIDRQTHLVRYHAMFTPQRKVYEMKIQKLRPNAAVTDSKFEI